MRKFARLVLSGARAPQKRSPLQLFARPNARLARDFVKSSSSRRRLKGWSQREIQSNQTLGTCASLAAREAHEEDEEEEAQLMLRFRR